MPNNDSKLSMKSEKLTQIWHTSLSEPANQEMENQLLNQACCAPLI